MNSRALIVIRFAIINVLLICTEAKPFSNITVIGSVYCDACSNSSFSKHNFFLKGAKVLVQCNFKMNSTSSEQLSLEAERTTDQYGIYKLDVPPVDGFECREGHEVKSACSASLIKSSSSSCNVPALKGATQHIAIKSTKANACYFNLNALNYRPAKKDTSICKGDNKPGVAPTSTDVYNASLFFWPFFWPLLPPIWSPFGIPPSLPFPLPQIPLPDPTSLPFVIPRWLLPFLMPPYLPFPLYQSSPSSPPPSYHFSTSEGPITKP